jgi:hypothetical protein
MRCCVTCSDVWDNFSMRGAVHLRQPVRSSGLPDVTEVPSRRHYKPPPHR